MVKIGLEVHMYPKTLSKMFCTCKADLKDEPNTNICPICTGQPGSKPMGLNKKAFEISLMLAKALNCKIVTNEKVFVQRKHYFYPDLPNNYQRTSRPIAEKGSFRGVRITEIHVEEDPGQYELRKGEVDYNRCGFPLIEIVTEPDMKIPEDAYRFLTDLKEVIDYLGVGREGFKVDTNVSTGGERVEVKNVNSIENVKLALEYEIERQKKEGAKRETRHFDALFGNTVTLREKETAEDYRYMPDPDVPPIVITQKMIDEIVLPEDLFKLRERLIKTYKITEETARVLSSDQDLVKLYEKLSRIEPAFVADWLKKDLKGELNYRNKSLAEAKVDEKEIEKLLKAIHDSKITRLKGKDLLRMYLDKGKSIEIEKSKIDVDKAVDEVVAEQKEVVEKYKGGKTSVLNFLIGEVSRKVRKEADIKTIKKKLVKKIS
jgi:aspartyl-tRNA(Asn)/glutamyl-tRNA(Gln) amidotransferase subunit B